MRLSKIVQKRNRGGIVQPKAGGSRSRTPRSHLIPNMIADIDPHLKRKPNLEIDDELLEIADLLSEVCDPLPPQRKSQYASTIFHIRATSPVPWCV